MSDSSPAAAASVPPVVDPQDPLPESNWFWRRTFVFAGSLICLAGLGIVMFMLYGLGHTVLDLIGRLEQTRDVRSLDQSLQAVAAVIDALYRLGLRLVIVVLVLAALYLIAPSAEQATRWLATVSAWKGGVSTSSVARAFAPDGSVAESGSAVSGAGAGAAPAPLPVPPPPPPASQEIDAAPSSEHD